MAIVGSSHVRNWKRGQFPKIRVYYGEPFAYERVEAPTRGQEQAVADAIFAEVRKLYEAATRPGSAVLSRPPAACPGTSRASSAPTASTAAPTHAALVMPSTNACGEA